MSAGRDISLIRPIYVSDRPNAPIKLGQSPIEITSQDQTIRGAGEAVLHFQPRSRLIISAQSLHGSASAVFQLGPEDWVTLRYGSHVKPIKAFIVRIAFSSGRGNEIEFLPSPQFMVGMQRRKRLQSMTFHVVNFLNFFGATDIIHRPKPGASQRLGRVVLAYDGWEIEIQALPSTSAIVEQLKKEGGHAITHVGSLRRSDGKTFLRSAVELIMKDLHLFLSFAHGAWTAPTLSVGFDAQGNTVVEEWGLPLSMPWESPRAWFDVHNGQTLAALYPGFMKLLRDPKLGRAVSSALYWYLRSNRGGDGAGVDSGVILSQAALETLTEAYLDSRKISLLPEARAADRLREAFRDLRLPLAIPRDCSGVYAARRKKVWRDIPEAITKVRNELIHPHRRLRIDLHNVVSDTWNLAQWCVELAVLRLSDYNGVYGNRIRGRWVGQVEQVPWKK
jgi:hypothetical protein